MYNLSSMVIMSLALAMVLPFKVLFQTIESSYFRYEKNSATFNKVEDDSITVTPNHLGFQA